MSLHQFESWFVMRVGFFFFYPQVDSANTGRVLASDAAVFLKKSGLTDLVLGKVFNDKNLIILALASVSVLCKLKYLERYGRIHDLPYCVFSRVV